MNAFGVDGKTMNKVYDMLKTLTMKEMEHFKAIALDDFRKGDMQEQELYLLLYQIKYAMYRGWFVKP